MTVLLVWSKAVLSQQSAHRCAAPKPPNTKQLNPTSPQPHPNQCNPNDEQGGSVLAHLTELLAAEERLAEAQSALAATERRLAATAAAGKEFKKWVLVLNGIGLHY